jgi:putative FmdB family regulatory protein
MPIYAYRCTACGHAQDVLRKLSDPVLTVCPACGASAYAKQVTAAGFQLKGSGWYVTDFRGGNAVRKEGEAGAPAADKAAEQGADKSGDKPGDKPGEQPGDRKAENKAENKSDKAADAKAPAAAPAAVPAPPPASGS